MAARILVIEDDPASLELLKYLLERVGHTVRGAPDGATGLRAALDNAYDLVLCDLQMPELTGFEVISQLKANPDWRPVPVVAVTAYSMPGDRESVVGAGFTEYITKPIDPDTFLSDVELWLVGGRKPGGA
jgi:two-component system cell cycle response regulator DivK